MNDMKLRLVYSKIQYCTCVLENGPWSPCEDIGISQIQFKNLLKSFLNWRGTPTFVDHIRCTSVPERDTDVHIESEIERRRPWLRFWTSAHISENSEAGMRQNSAASAENFVYVQN